MKLATCLSTIFGLLLAARALPSLVPYDENAIEIRGITSTGYSLAARDEPFVREDDEIFERYFGQELDLTEREWAEGTVEPRQYAKVAEQAAELIIKGVIKIVDFRGQWTSHMVEDLHKKYPHFNFVVCHTAHNYNFKGQKGKDWGHSHQEIPVSFGKTVGYEIYWFKEGVFRRTGDGGYLNWAYYGNVKSATNKNSVITFNKP
ncbi:hypothetical protein D9613_003998 [Agrocybe pediades]|uniref:Uncharacterized protein n=1 Tax=Agrocybe pediades TaxID=84607 RepID=A0A8H4QJX6_9AGAR|nr:hypothetical protein D9613_003998 [Agrocybe pediades]